MNNLITEIKQMEKSSLSKRVNKRLDEFASFKDKCSEEWFSELCFCLLTANSKAKTAIQIQNELGSVGFCTYDKDFIRDIIIKNKHRFHNNKSQYIVEARHCLNPKSVINSIVSKEDTKSAREWLVQNIKGLGYKEASHFLRNVGFFDVAILDRHILNLMIEYDYIKEKPKALTKKIYLKIETKFNKIATELKMNLAELDLYMWYLKTGEILK